jgi:nitrite reductase/ring-hydroxylating ferredoxin subunit
MSRTHGFAASQLLSSANTGSSMELDPNMMVSLLSAMDMATLQPLSAQEVTLRVRGDDGAIRHLGVIILKAADGILRAYENNCPHQGGPLNASPGGRFFSINQKREVSRNRDQGLLVCSRHGARFRPDDGLCVRGPCAGHALHVLPIQSDDSHGVTASIADVRRAACFGGRLVTDDVMGTAPGSDGKLVQVQLHPMVEAAATSNAADASESVQQRAHQTDPEYPMPKSPAPLDASGVRCRWDARLGCWRAVDGSVHFVRGSKR